MAGLSVVIPTLEEAGRLPLLLADLRRWPGSLEIIVVDGGSQDQTALTARLAGATVLHAHPPGRGQQLCLGVEHSKGDWLLVLHADSRIPAIWTERVKGVMTMDGSTRQAWSFDFRVDERRPMLRLLEWAVRVRSGWMQRPYGDQGLLIHRQLYEAVGGYRPLSLMEDLDLIERLGARTLIRSLDCPLVTSARRWDQKNVLAQAWRNAMLRRFWRRGATPEQLMKIYRS